MKLPLWLIALLFLGYCVWCAYFWNSYQIRNCCGEAATALSAAKQTDGTPLFRWNADKPEPDDKFAAWKRPNLQKVDRAIPWSSRDSTAAVKPTANNLHSPALPPFAT
ncbi:MAG: hypothetical protein IPJ82_22575 [Lewinellaceae bacterium]|nr:hypothetical protein [Lewinellaceae bacterium]